MQLSIPNNLNNELIELSKIYKLEPSKMVIEAITKYIQDKKSNIIYKNFEEATKELKNVLDNKTKLQTLDEFLDEL